MDDIRKKAESETALTVGTWHNKGCEWDESGRLTMLHLDKLEKAFADRLEVEMRKVEILTDHQDEIYECLDFTRARSEQTGESPMDVVNDLKKNTKDLERKVVELEKTKQNLQRDDEESYKRIKSQAKIIEVLEGAVKAIADQTEYGLCLTDGSIAREAIKQVEELRKGAG